MVSLELQVARIVEELAQYNGHRTLWLDRRGFLCHAEPEDDFEDIGYQYVATLLRPTAEELRLTITQFTARRAARIGACPVPAAFHMHPIPVLMAV
jgi:hypothetical protein